MKKSIIIAIILVAVMAAVLFFLYRPEKHTVSDFSLYPCDYAAADQISISSPGRSILLDRNNAPWRLVEPRTEPLDDSARAQLDVFMRGRLFVDDKRPLDDQAKRDFSAKTPTRIAFIHNGKSICAFELGKSLKLPTVDSERRWVFPENGNQAMRAFVPLLDFGLLFEQPSYVWRQRKWFDPQGDIERIDIISDSESFSLDPNGPKSEHNSAGWQIFNAKENNTPIDLTHFDLDIDRVATIRALIYPLYVDDWAFDLDEGEKNAIYYGGKLVFRAKNSDHTLEISSEVDFSKHPEWMSLGEGTRFVRFDGKQEIAVMSGQRIIGLFPFLDDMRSKNVWALDSSTFAAFEIERADSCVRYSPIAKDSWGIKPCLSPQADPVSIPNRDLALFTQTLLRLQAVRYITPLEAETARDMLANPDAVLRIYSGHDAALSATLALSAPLKSLFRYAKVSYPDASAAATPVFVLSEGIAALLLRNASVKISQ